MTKPLLLALDASTYSGSVAVISGETVLAESTVAMRGEKSERLLPAVHATLESAGAQPAALDRVVCGAGPGSFTSLRIAASIAKGFCFALGVPLLAVSSPWLLVAGSALQPGRYLAVLDAMRGDVFAQAFAVSDSGAVEPVAELRLVSADDLGEYAEELGATLAGPAQALVVVPHARGAALLERSPGVASEVQLDAWEPDYGRLAEAQVKWEAAHGQPLPRG